jgi:putative restriction endonuclease
MVSLRPDTQASMNPLDRTRLEKALADHGFDLTPVVEGGWVVGRSTLHPVAVGIRQNADASIMVRTWDANLGAAMVREGMAFVPGDESQAWEFRCPDYQDFYRVLGRYAALARSLPNHVAARFAIATAKLPTTTEAERLVVQRIGQNLFREALIDYWQGRCAVTGLDVVPLLRASHIKPWAACESDMERLDVFNGLLLAPHLDALFDGGWVTFDDDGVMHISETLTEEARVRLGLGKWKSLSHASDRHRKYLSYHRQTVFREE